MKSAKEYVLAGGDIKAIEGKYKLTDKQKKVLIKLHEEKRDLTKA